MANPNILIVDDVDFFLEIEKHFLKNTPATIRTAKNGREALEKVREYPPDLIYLDLNMPLMDGATCCRLLKSEERFRKIPIIMVLAAKGQEDLDVCRSAGCDEIITKPVDKRLFLELGHKFLYNIDRRDLRVPFQTSIKIWMEGKEYRGESFDLSENGIYVKYREPVPEDATLRLAFTLGSEPDQEVFEVGGRVSWVNQGFPRSNMNLPQGFGVEFKLMNKAKTELLKNWVDQHM